MNFSDRIIFVTEIGGGYNSGTGEHEDVTLTPDVIPCNLSSLGVTRSKELFGEIDTNIQIARLQRPYNKPFNYVLINNGRYDVKRNIKHSKNVFYLEGSAL